MNKGQSEEQIHAFYELLLNYEEGVESPVGWPKIKHVESKRIGFRYVVIPLLALGVCLIAFWLTELQFFRLILLITLLVGYVGIIAVSLLELYADHKDLAGMLRNPLRLSIGSLQKSSGRIVELCEALRAFPTETLLLAKTDIEWHKSAIEKRIGLMLGALEKFGLIPGLISLYFAIASGSSQKVALLVALILFFYYIIAYAIHFALPRYGMYSRLIQLELDSRQGA